MASTLVKLYVHITFHVKTTGMNLMHDNLDQLFAYISGIIKNLGGVPCQVGGMEDHVHILATLPKNESLSDFVRTIKSESSKWLKTIDSRYVRFSWQQGYGAFSVSQSMVDRTKQYILNQAEHHKKLTFTDEYKKFLAAYHIDYDSNYAFSD